jgi:hypothetical protein
LVTASTWARAVPSNKGPCCRHPLQVGQGGGRGRDRTCVRSLVSRQGRSAVLTGALGVLQPASGPLLSGHCSTTRRRLLASEASNDTPALGSSAFTPRTCDRTGPSAHLLQASRTAQASAARPTATLAANRVLAAVAAGTEQVVGALGGCAVRSAAGSRRGSSGCRSCPPAERLREV